MNRTPVSNARKTPSPDLSESPSTALNLHVSDDGHLDVSNNGLTRISDRQMKNLHNLSSVVSLNASRNRFVVIDFLKLIPNCKCVDASDNQLKRLLTFIQLKKSLEILDVSYNQISSTEHFLSQLPSLKALSIHHNSLTTFPAIDELVNLTSLDVSYNQLLNLPQVKRLPHLTFLALNGNRITNLKDIANCLPVNLARLELAENLVADLTEITYLKGLPNLEDFCFASNPAVLPPNNKFNYRPYIVSKQLNLKMINDLEVSDEERLVAEHLHINKKISPLGPGEGNHTTLVKFLEIESPLDHPLETLTPTHPSLKAVREDYLQNKSVSASLSSTPRISKTPDANIRKISPRRSATFDESSVILKPLTLPPRRRLHSIDGHSSSSDSTVILSTSISEAMNLACPRIGSSDDSARTQSLVDFPPDTPVTVVESRPSTSNQTTLENDFILPPIVPSCTKIIKESPFHSVIDDTVDNENCNSEGNSTNQANRTLTIVPNVNGSKSNEIHPANQDLVDIRIVKLENRIGKLESEKNVDINVMMSSLIETTNRLTDLLVDVNMMAKSVIGITNNLTNFLMTQQMNISNPRNTPSTTVQQQLNSSFNSIPQFATPKEDMITNGNGIKYTRSEKI